MHNTWQYCGVQALSQPSPPAVLLRRVVVTAVKPEVAAGTIDIVNVEVVVDETVVETPRSDKKNHGSSRSIYLHAATI